MEVFARRAGVDMVHIPNKTGAAGMINDLVVGDAQIAFLNAASSAAMIRAGKLRPIAVLAEQRLADYPDVPTLAEAGFPGVGTLHWQSMLAPAQTPKPVLETLFKAIQEAAKKPAAAGGVRQAVRQREAERVARRGADLAQQRARVVAQDHRRGEDRPVESEVTAVRHAGLAGHPVISPEDMVHGTAGCKARQCTGERRHES